MLRKLAIVGVVSLQALAVSWVGAAPASGDVPEVPTATSTTDCALSESSDSSGKDQPGVGDRYGDSNYHTRCTATSGVISEEPPPGMSECYYTSEENTQEKTECRKGDLWWSASRQLYCREAPGEAVMSQDSAIEDEDMPPGTWIACFHRDGSFENMHYVYFSPAAPDHGPAVREVVESLTLHPPKVGVGAFVYPGYEEWGLSWWVGAPLWLWIDSSDDAVQWGSHEITAALDGVSVTAVFKPARVSYDMGDGGGPVVCYRQGVERPWGRAERMGDHCPAGCEYVYRRTNTLGDVGSRFAVSAAVTWAVSWWTSDGGRGEFEVVKKSVDSPSIHVGRILVVLVPNSDGFER